MKERDLISITDLSKDDILGVLDLAEEIDLYPKNFCDLTNNYIMGSLFFQPSTRTRGSFESAMTRLGGRVLSVSGEGGTSITKGETLEDTIRMWDDYSDFIVMRHSESFSPLLASNVSDVPIINAGDGINEHPTQTLTDLYTIRKLFGTIENCDFIIYGDLYNGRTVHSLIHGALMFNNTVTLVAGEGLELSETTLEILKQRYTINVTTGWYPLKEFGMNFSSMYHLSKGYAPYNEFPTIHYFTRRQTAYTSGFYPCLTYNMMAHRFFSEGVILHPLPRQIEVPKEIDNHPACKYFEQAQNGVPVRMALILKILGIVP